VGAVVSDTPRTTALDSGGISDMKVGGSYYAMRELARSLERENAQLREALSAISGLARSFPRPSEQPALCRMLLDVEGIARATLEAK
jgi:hypothetical protein